MKTFTGKYVQYVPLSMDIVRLPICRHMSFFLSVIFHYSIYCTDFQLNIYILHT